MVTHVRTTHTQWVQQDMTAASPEAILHLSAISGRRRRLLNLREAVAAGGGWYFLSHL